MERDRQNQRITPPLASKCGPTRDASGATSSTPAWTPAPLCQGRVGHQGLKFTNWRKKGQDGRNHSDDEPPRPPGHRPGAASPPVSGQGAPAGVGGPAGGGHLPVLGGRDVPPAARTRPEPETARPDRPPLQSRARADGPGPRPGLEPGLTKPRGPGPGRFFDVYAMIDIHPRYVAPRKVHTTEAGPAAQRLSENRIAANGGIAADTVPSDPGTAGISQPVADLPSTLGSGTSHSRPKTSHDTPYSEAQSKTLKHRPAVPHRFGSLQGARWYCRRFFDFSDYEHRHSGTGLHTPFPSRRTSAPHRRSRTNKPRPSRHSAQPPHTGFNPPPGHPETTRSNRPHPPPTTAPTCTKQPDEHPPPSDST